MPSGYHHTGQLSSAASLTRGQPVSSCPFTFREHRKKKKMKTVELEGDLEIVLPNPLFCKRGSWGSERVSSSKTQISGPASGLQSTLWDLSSMQSGDERPLPRGHQENFLVAVMGLSMHSSVLGPTYDLWQVGKRSRWGKGCCLWE